MVVYLLITAKARLANYGNNKKTAGTSGIMSAIIFWMVASNDIASSSML